MALSSRGLSTYSAYTGGSTESALELYQWSMEVSSGMMVPIRVAEAVLRAAIAEAISNCHGENWPWSEGFLRTISNSGRSYNQYEDIVKARKSAEEPKGVLMGTRFAFWQKMLTKRHDNAIWIPYFQTTFPNAPSDVHVISLRQTLYKCVDDVRLFRNRIAHHDPIFRRPLEKDLERMDMIVRWRCEVTADWLSSINPVSRLLSQRPAAPSH